jgi:hypothetical protein
MAIRHGIDMALAAPQVVAHRVARLASARAPLSARQQREFMAMGLEKAVAFQQSWLAMGLEVARLQQRAMLSWWQAAWTPWWSAARTPAASRSDWQRVAMGIAGAGIRPIRRKVVANARRFQRVRR